MPKFSRQPKRSAGKPVSASMGPGADCPPRGPTGGDGSTNDTAERAARHIARDERRSEHDPPVNSADLGDIAARLPRARRERGSPSAALRPPPAYSAAGRPPTTAPRAPRDFSSTATPPDLARRARQSPIVSPRRLAPLRSIRPARRATSDSTFVPIPAAAAAARGARRSSSTALPSSTVLEPPTRSATSVSWAPTWWRMAPPTRGVTCTQITHCATQETCTSANDSQCATCDRVPSRPYAGGADVCQPCTSIDGCTSPLTCTTKQQLAVHQLHGRPLPAPGRRSSDCRHVSLCTPVSFCTSAVTCNTAINSQCAPRARSGSTLTTLVRDRLFELPGRHALHRRRSVLRRHDATVHTCQDGYYLQDGPPTRAINVPPSTTAPRR
jgi:hypothetical protein